MAGAHRSEQPERATDAGKPSPRGRETNFFKNLKIPERGQLSWPAVRSRVEEINVSFLQRLSCIHNLFSSETAANHLLKPNLVLLADDPRADNPEQGIVKRVVAAVGCVAAFVHKVTVLCIYIVLVGFVMLSGMFICTWISINGLVQDGYRCHCGSTDEGTTNMDIAHVVLYILCLMQGALWLYKFMLTLSEKGTIKQVSQAYGFEDGTAVSGYLEEIKRGCFKKPSYAKGRNLITYAVQLMESNSFGMCLSGTLILDRLLTRQHSDKIRAYPDVVQKDEINQLKPQLEDKTGASLNKNDMKKKMKEEKHRQSEEVIISTQRRVIKRLIVSTSYTNILQKLLEMLDSRSLYDRKTREAAARIVEHVASGIYLEQFPRGIQCISSLIITFEEYRLQPYQSLSSSSTNEATKTTPPPSCNTNTMPSPNTTNGLEEQGNNTAATLSKLESDNGMDRSSSSKATKSKTGSFHGYKELVLTGLHILWGLTGHHDNCIIIRNTKHLVSKIMAPVTYDLVHGTHHSAWSSRVVEGSMKVILRLVTADGETGAELRRRISSDNKAMATMERIFRCEKCKGVELQMTAMQIITALVSTDGETESSVSFTEMLVSIFVNGDTSDAFVRKSAGEALALLIFGNKHVPTIPSIVNNDASEFFGGLITIVSQVGNDDTCRKIAAEILEHLCSHYPENHEDLSTLKNAITGVMPNVLREILLGCGSTGGEGSTVYAESGADVESQDAIVGGTVVSQVNASPEQNQGHSLRVALLSLCMTACEKLHLDFCTMDPLGEGAAFSLARKMVQLNSDLTLDCLTTVKLATRMVIAMMKCRGVTEPADLDLEILVNSLSNVSETMLDLESSMVFATGMDVTSRTLDSLVKEARELHSQINEQDLATI